MHAEALLDAGGVPALVLGEVPLLVVRAQHLAEVLVGRDDHAAEAVSAQCHQGAADEVIGLEAVVAQHGAAQRCGQLLAVIELALE